MFLIPSDAEAGCRRTCIEPGKAGRSPPLTTLGFFSLPLRWQETGDIDCQHPCSQINGVLKFSGIAALPDIFRSEQLDHHPAAVTWVDLLQFKTS